MKVRMRISPMRSRMRVSSMRSRMRVSSMRSRMRCHAVPCRAVPCRGVHQTVSRWWWCTQVGGVYIYTCTYVYIHIYIYMYIHHVSNPPYPQDPHIWWLITPRILILDISARIHCKPLRNLTQMLRILSNSWHFLNGLQWIPERTIRICHPGSYKKMRVSHKDLNRHGGTHCNPLRNLSLPDQRFLPFLTISKNSSMIYNGFWEDLSRMSGIQQEREKTWGFGIRIGDRMLPFLTFLDNSSMIYNRISRECPEYI